MRNRLINRSEQGDLGEASAIEWLTGIGATVLIPVGHSPHFDLVAAVRGRLWRIQVKTSTICSITTNGYERYAVQLADSRRQPELGRSMQEASIRPSDYLFVMVGDGRRWMIPTCEFETDRTTLQSRAVEGTPSTRFRRGINLDSVVHGADTDTSTIANPVGGAPKLESRAGL